MGQDVADAMLGINSGSHAMTMMNEARMMQPETQMQYIDYQIKKQQLDDMEALRQVNVQLGQPSQLNAAPATDQERSTVTTPATQSETPYLDEEERRAKAYFNSPNLSLQAAGRELMANIGKERRALANKGGQKVVDARTLRALLPQIATKGADGQWVQNPNADPNLVSQYNDAYMRRHGPTQITDPVTKATTVQQSIAPKDLLVPSSMPQPETTGQIYRKQYENEVIALDFQGLSEPQSKRAGFANRMANAAQQMAAIEANQGEKKGLPLAKLQMFTSFTGEGADAFTAFITEQITADKALTDEQKAYIQAGRNMLLAILRPETGAVIGPSEVSDTAKLVFKTHDMNQSRQDMTDNYRSDQVISVIDSMPDAWKFKSVRLQQWYDIFGEKEFNKDILEVLKNSNLFRHGDPARVPRFYKEIREKEEVNKKPQPNRFTPGQFEG